MPITTVWPWPYRAAPVCITHTQLPLWPHLGPLNQSLEPIRVSPSLSPPPHSSGPDTTDGFCLQGGASSLTAAAVNLALPQPSTQRAKWAHPFAQPLLRRWNIEDDDDDDDDGNYWWFPQPLASLRGGGRAVVLCLCVDGPAQGGMNRLSSGHCVDHLADCISAVD